MKKWISFGDINKYLFYPFVGGMVKLLLELILDKIDAEFFSHPLIKGVNAGFGMSLSFIPFLITIIRTKKLNAISSNIAVYANEKLEGRKKIIQGKFALLFICAFLDFLLKYWNSVTPLLSKKERTEALNTEKLLQQVNKESLRYSELAEKGEYIIKL